ncbi:putative beta-galactosidase [Medicago truncatula]|uniref:beta-galactosidase n=1 Tax=Medicago truncatula TaxID=3880 RepID=A0A396HLW0_MEDTR|nr:putative beta-galactosidase [Medicago truncatula]
MVKGCFFSFYGSVHYPRCPPEFNFEGNYDLIKFIKMIGIMICMQHLELVHSLKHNEIMAVQQAYKEHGMRYVQWEGNMAVGLDTGVPWIMCKQVNALGPVMNTCNGRYRAFGDPPSERTAEDIAIAVARFFSKKGTMANYYMYYGGTNFGRTSSSFVTTQYYDEAPIVEYGLPREPKWGHFRDLHDALKLCQKALLWGTQPVQMLGKDLEVGQKQFGSYVSMLPFKWKPCPKEWFGYHTPRAILQPKNNFLVVLEEMGGKLDGIEILTVNRDTICSIAGEHYPPNVETWSRYKGVIRTNVDTPKPAANLVCLDNKTITQVDFASYGDPVGNCGHFILGKCNAPNSQKIVE